MFSKIDWQRDTLTFSIDGKVVRTVKKSETFDSAGVAHYPTTPSRVQLSSVFHPFLNYLSDFWTASGLLVLQAPLQEPLIGLEVIELVLQFEQFTRLTLSLRRRHDQLGRPRLQSIRALLRADQVCDD